MDAQGFDLSLDALGMARQPHRQRRCLLLASRAIGPISPLRREAS